MAVSAPCSARSRFPIVFFRLSLRWFSTTTLWSRSLSKQKTEYTGITLVKWKSGWSMNRYEYAQEIVFCDLCGEYEAKKYRLCSACYGAYITYYNFVLNNKRDPRTPLSPEEYAHYKKNEREILRKKGFL